MKNKDHTPRGNDNQKNIYLMGICPSCDQDTFFNYVGDDGENHPKVRLQRKAAFSTIWSCINCKTHVRYDHIQNYARHDDNAMESWHAATRHFISWGCFTAECRTTGQLPQLWWAYVVCIHRGATVAASGCFTTWCGCGASVGMLLLWVISGSDAGAYRRLRSLRPSDHQASMACYLIHCKERTPDA